MEDRGGARIGGRDEVFRVEGTKLSWVEMDKRWGAWGAV